MSTRKDDTRYRLFEAARKLLLKRGFHGVGLEDIAEAAGVSRQAVYKSHFDSKADLLLKLVRHVHVAEKLDELTRPVFEAKTALEMLEATIRASVKIEARVHELSLVLASAAVSDDGAGMPEDIQRHAFDPFFTTTRAQGSTGLGLSIVHNLVTDQLGGRISLVSAPAQGTTISMTLPLRAPAQIEPAAAGHV